VSNNGSRATGPSGAPKALFAGRPRPDDVVRHRVHLSGGRDAVPGARAAIDLLTVELFDELACEDIRLMVSELVGNSVRHGGAPTGSDHIELTVFLAKSLLRVECSDPAAGFDVPQSADGYGLEIVDTLASDWGVRYGAAGSTWFEYPREVTSAAASA
jgi:anti-sigma regulatory factor (Ser/Thr protein kinase)